ncbi:MAG: preprotein translocase subunit SecY [Christensenellaceae bacterium]|nr:preprotein translocase subunit SecY [Christensenellaceae bacterium]MBR3843504.1 preprotein translocase subunit SecY [Christensenellaceae bacterium]
MFRVIVNAWKVKEIREKILYTLLILLIYKIGCFVPVPGVDVAYIAEQVKNFDFLGFLNLFSGGSLSQMTIFALGVSPYINSSIIMNLLTIAIPALERLAKEEDGKEKIADITRYVTIGLAVIQAIGVLVMLGEDAFIASSTGFGKFMNYFTVVACLTAGTSLVVWFGDKINEKGIGNGVSLIIFIGIVSSLPTTVISMFKSVFEGTTAWWILVIVIVVMAAVIVGITMVEKAERRVPVQYAKRVVGRRQMGGQSSYIPMKVNQSGVMPIIFAVTFIQFPLMIAQFWPDSAFYAWYTKYMGGGSALYAIIYALLIFGFTYFYAQIAFNPVDISKNIQQYGGFVPGIRPGKPTSDYLTRILSRITFFGAVFLALIAAIPTLFSIAGLSNAFSSTSLMIAISVALETMTTLESQMMMRHYKGFLK